MNHHLWYTCLVYSRAAQVRSSFLWLRRPLVVQHMFHSSWLIGSDIEYNRFYMESLRTFVYISYQHMHAFIESRCIHVLNVISHEAIWLILYFIQTFFSEGTLYYLKKTILDLCWFSGFKENLGYTVYLRFFSFTILCSTTAKADVWRWKWHPALRCFPFHAWTNKWNMQIH